MSPRRRARVAVYPTPGRHEYVVATTTAVGLVVAAGVSVGLLPPVLALPAALFVKAAWRLDKTTNTPSGP